MPKKNNLGDCYVVAGKFAMGDYDNIEFNGTPHVVHAEVMGQGAIKGIRYGHAWVEDDVNVYDYSNDRQLVIPKQIYYYIGQVQENNPKKYRKYTFEEAVNKMLETGNYGCWDIEVEFAKGGLIAPNGKPSNLTPEQYKLVRTPEFKEWFGDWEKDPTNASKVVDENGEPLVVFHNTDEVFNIWNFKKINKKRGTILNGAYFTPISDEQWGKIKISCFLSIKNPLTFDFDKLSVNVRDIQYFIKENKWFWIEQMTNNSIDDYKNGDDNGLIFLNTKYSGLKKNEYVVFSSNQIKFADGKNTTFDTNNPDMRFAKGGEIGKYYRAVDTFYGQTFYFEPRGYYEAFDDDGSPIVVSGSDVFRKSTKPELSASKTIGGAILGLWSMYNHNGIDSVDKSVYIYEINKEPYKDLSNVNMYDFAYLKEVRYDKPVVGKYVGKFTYDQKFEEDAKNFYERIADNDPYSESEYDLDKWEDFEKYLITLNKKDLVNTFAKGGLIAPNGKPSNLTPEQYKLVRTPEFKAWFGDWENEPDNASKVVDENGEPLVCYHGTIHNFTIFRDYDVERYSTFETKGFYFTPQLEHAKQWGKRGDARDESHRAIPVFLNIRYMVTLDEVTKAKVFVDMFGWDIIHSLSIRFGYEITNPNQFDNPRFQDPTYRYFKDEPPRDMLGSDVKALSLKMGIGGYRFVAQYGFSKNKNDKKTYVYAVFEPNNIKLADGTNTAFDSNNPDIRFDDGGMVDDIEGEYSGLHNFLYMNPSYIPVFAKKYQIKESDWEDYVHGDLGTDEEILIDILGKNYRVFYNDDSDEFEISLKKQKPKGTSSISIVTDDTKNKVLDILNNQILSEYEPRLAITWNNNIVGGSTYSLEKGTYRFDMAIEPKYQGYGLSKMVIEAIVQDALNLGAKNIKAEIVNNKLHAPLMAMGFEVYQDGDEMFAFMDLQKTKKDKKYDNGGEVNSITTMFFGNRAGGVLVYCSTTNRYLILLRSIYVLEPFTWGIISGKVDDTDVNIEEAVRREAIEEAGIYLPELIPSYVFKRPNFEFHNFIAIVDEEFEPRLNWENMDYAWVSLENMPNNIHFGLKELLENEDLPKLVGDNTSFSHGGLTPNYNTQLAKQVLEQELPKIKALECDGATRVLHYALTKAGVNHVIKQGYVKYDDDLIIPFHFWIELPDGHIIDCKSRMWLNDEVMEGMFLPKRNTYLGKEVELKMTEAMYKILTMENGGEIMQQDYSGYHTSIVAIKNNKGDILILQRGSTAPWMPNAWSLVGGGVDDGETPINAAIREAVEEISVNLTDVKFASRLYTEDMGVLYYFTATLPNGASVKLDWENQAYAWVNASNYEDYEYVPYVKEFIEKQLGLYGDGGVVFDKWAYKPLKDIIGKRFREVYHTMLTPADFRIKVKSYYSVQERLKNKNYKDVPTSLTKDKNKLKSDEANIENYKYLASIVVDGRGFIRGIDKSLIPKPKSEYAKGGKVGGVSAKNYFHETHCDFKPVTPEDAKEILDGYKEWRKKRKKPQYIHSSKYGNLRVDFTSEKSNAFSNSRSLSYYFVSENEDFIIRISDHWSKSQYPKSRKLNCMLISTCFWSNTKGEKFTYRMPSQEYSSSLIAGVCHFKDFKKH